MKTVKTISDRKLRVAFIEDDKTMLSLLQKYVAKAPNMEVCGAWESAENAIALIHACSPDVVIVDLELPHMTGEQCIRVLSAMLPCAALVVLTIHEKPERVFGALEAGANGYLLKPSSYEILTEGILAAHQGGAPLSPVIAGLVIRAFQKSPPKKPGIPLPSLSRRERQILELLSTGSVPKEAAAELHLSYETVRDYMKRIYQKLHVRSRTEAVLRYLDAREAT